MYHYGKRNEILISACKNYFIWNVSQKFVDKLAPLPFLLFFFSSLFHERNSNAAWKRYSGVQLPEGLSGHHGVLTESPFKPLIHHGSMVARGIKEGPQLGRHYAEGRQPMYSFADRNVGFMSGPLTSCKIYIYVTLIYTLYNRI